MQSDRQQNPFESFIRKKLDYILPERKMHLRTGSKISYFLLTQNTQLFIVLIVFLFIGWIQFTTMNFFQHENVLAEKDNEISNAKNAYRKLLGEVSDYQKKFTNLTLDLEDSHSLMIGLVEKNATLRQKLSKVSIKLDLTKSERKQIASARENLKQKLSAIEDKMRDISNENFSLADNLSTAESDLQKALSGRNKALYEGTRMSRTIKNLEKRIKHFKKTEEQSIQRLTDSTTKYIKTMKKVITMAGIDINKLIKGFNIPKIGQGGPFIAAESENMPGNDLKISLDNLEHQLSLREALQSVMKKIPLAPPLNSYYITSSFGKRRDPINKRWAAHYGLDLGSPFNSRVYSTAPGVVSFAGWKGKYGKLVEIDHGSGIKTRYGHLNKFSIKKGQKVKFHQKIGNLGSTGRSTGAHLHYEVIFRGKALNPIKFIKAGRNVFQE
ncbi:MAG: peptidoglycan DD-metalloendopeptidase family protein [Pseudomonadota bacterium]|nr:peptidoglycan DD-metalloendopeptidase family protein [Pseudomonadota bacterium]